CPFKCNFCSHFVHGSKIRYRSVESVIKEIDFLKDKFGIDELFIIDDNFTLNRARAHKFFDTLIEKNYNLAITFSNGIRADTLTPKLLLKMKKAGTVEFAIGVESGNQEVLNKIGKRLDLRKVRAITPYIKKLQFIYKCFFIIGHPYDTPKSMMDTIKLAIELDPEVAQFSKATPWRGTELYNIIKKHGEFVKKSKNVKSFDLSTSHFKIWAITPRLMNKYFMLAYLMFYFRPSKVFSFIKKIRTYYQLKWYFSNTIRILIQMISK
ncbi:MAG: B12-binding domain-containing radical SAM protein, partial [Promethearchaeota archaeon]